MAYLELRTPQGVKRLKLAESSITIGRLGDNTVVLSDELASRHHCIIEPWQGGFRLRDLGSRNGTKLNENRVKTEALDNGDVVMIGTTELRFIDPDQEFSRKRQETPDFSAWPRQRYPPLACIRLLDYTDDHGTLTCCGSDKCARSHSG